MKITISGKPGAGKSTVGKLLAKKLKYKHYSNGDFMREMAKERGMSLLELSRLAEKDRSIDIEIDKRQIELGKKKDNFVIDSRLGFHFIPDSVKIFLDADINERVRRVFKDQRKEEGKAGSLKEMKKKMLMREKSERKRYKEYYDLDPYDKRNFDLVIDTTRISPDKAITKIMKFIKSFK